MLPSASNAKTSSGTAQMLGNFSNFIDMANDMNNDIFSSQNMINQIQDMHKKGVQQGYETSSADESTTDLLDLFSSWNNDY